MKRGEWLKTPYAGSTAERTDEATQRLFARYGIDEYQWTQCRGPNGRPAISIRFRLEDRTYRMGIETLDVEGAQPEELLTQVRRALFYFLKSTLEMQSVFFTADQVLFAFLELPDGPTVYEAAAPRLLGLASPDIGRLLGPAPEARS